MKGGMGGMGWTGSACGHTEPRTSESEARCQRQLAPGVPAFAKATARLAVAWRVTASGGGGPRRHWKKVGGWLLAVTLGLLTPSCSAPSPPDAKDYAAKITADRAAKDSAFQTDADSPIPPGRRGELLPLAYFPVDPDYDVPASLTPTEDRTVIDMPTSTGTMRQMRRVGTLDFTIKGEPLKLTAFVEAASPNLDRLFVPFNDQTSASETYQGGRYMDLDRTATRIYKVDFNRAYHPYCVYNATYECPFPPAENRLKVAIRAGEKLKKFEARSQK